jgi:hypothetical protein
MVAPLHIHRKLESPASKTSLVSERIRGKPMCSVRNVSKLATMLSDLVKFSFVGNPGVHVACAATNSLLPSRLVHRTTKHRFCDMWQLVVLMPLRMSRVSTSERANTQAIGRELRSLSGYSCKWVLVRSSARRHNGGLRGGVATADQFLICLALMVLAI